jgi:predicted NAD/FAD-dependent oxidoreductase
MKKKHIGIVGAGMAGLACATELVRSGFEVSLFDKSGGVGGRMSHRYYEKWGADHGAQYFTVKDTQFKSELDTWVRAGVVQEWLGKIVTLSQDGVQGHYKTTQRYVGVPTMSSPAKFLADRLSVSTMQTIDELRYSQGLWQMVSKEQGLLPTAFDQIILAIPSPQARVLIETHSTYLKQACENVVMLPCWTLMAYLKNPLPLNFDAAFVSDSLFSWLARDSNKPKRSPYETWVAQANHNWSLEHIDVSQMQAEELLLNEFKKITGVDCDLYQTHLWRYAKLETHTDTNYVIDSKLNIALCGDWLRNSTVEGAWLSGYSLAKRISWLSKIDTIHNLSKVNIS